MTNLPKLTGAEDFVNWKRRVKAYLQNQDFELIGLSDLPESASAELNRKWKESNVKDRSYITLPLAHGPLSQVCKIVDDDEPTAKELWEALDKTYRMSNTQIVISIESELETLELESDTDWEKHMERLHLLIGNMVSYDKLMSLEDQVSKSIETLPQLFAPVAMVAESSIVLFENGIA